MIQSKQKANGLKFIVLVIGLLALSLLIWFLGPLIAIAGVSPLESVLGRILLIGLIVLLVTGFYILQNKKQRQAAKQLEDGLSAPDHDAEHLVDEEIGILDNDFNQALSFLKQANGSKSSSQLLYQLPWYIFIGPPGSGKTTALINSGLEFPLADKFGDKRIKGVGGTRNCDWWFTDEAILIDTAGRYTTQDSHELVDKGGWLGFLDLLKKNRPLRPINGVIVAMSLADLLLQTEEELKQHGRAIRKRIQELDDKLGVDIPVYMMFTKSDLVAGFSEFFDDLDLDERQQVWGHTFEFQSSQEDLLSDFHHQYQSLIQRLDDRLLALMQAERNIQNRSLIFGFPRQMAALEIPLNNFLTEVFGINRYQKPNLLRGFYFTSGTQEGTPIDRLMGELASSFALDRQAVPLFSGQGKSYFITRLLKNVIFNEAELVGSDQKRESRRRLLQLGVYTLSALSLLSLSGFWLISYSKNTDALTYQHSLLEKYRQIPEHLRWQLDFKALQSRMDVLASVSQVFTDQDSGLMKVGLYQGNKLALPAQQAYHRFLEKYLLPAIRYRFEERLQDAVSQQDDLLYELLKVYLMLGNPEKMDWAMVKAWVNVDWELEFANEPQVLSHLKRHLEHLSTIDPEPVKLNTGLISNIRRVLTQVPLGYQIYNRIKSETIENPYGISADYAMGRFADRVFINIDGHLDQLKVPGLFTAEGYRKLFQKHSSRIIKQAIEQDWVLNRTASGSASINELRRLQMEIQDLYIKEYIGYWDGFLSKIRIRDTSGAEDTTELIGYLSGTDSPLKKLLSKVSDNTHLSRTTKQLAKSADSATADGLNPKMLAALKTLKEHYADEFKFSVAEIDQHFQKFNQFVYAEVGSASELDRFLSRFADVYTALIDLQQKNSFPGVQVSSPSDGKLVNDLQLIKYESNRLDPTIQGWINAVVNKAHGEFANSLQREMSQAWRNEVYVLCERSLKGRYPLNKGSRREVNLTDFSHFFTRQGALDQFFNQYLKGQVDITQRLWRLTPQAQKTLSISQSALRNFQYAALIKDKFFKYQIDRPAIQFSLKPLVKSEDLAQVTVEIDGQKLVFNEQPIRAKGFKWPGRDVGYVRILFEFKDGREKVVYQSDGSWALFRLLDVSVRGQIMNNTERVNLNLSSGASFAKFEMYTGGGINPFAISELRHFKCPKQL